MTRRRSNGDGGIYRRASDGRWVASVDLAPDGPGRRRKVLYGPTRREVVTKLRDAQQRLDDGASVEDSRTLVGPFLARWSVEGLGAASIKTTTRENYATIARTHLVPTLGHLRLDRLAPSDVDQLLAGRREQGLSDSTVRLIYTVLRRALDYAVRDGLHAGTWRRPSTGPPSRTGRRQSCPPRRRRRCSRRPAASASTLCSPWRWPPGSVVVRLWRFAGRT